MTGVAIVTGAGQGLGRAEALALAAAGLRVVVNDLGESADAAAAEITAAGGEAVAHPGDIGDWSFAASLVERAVETYGDLTVLVNNAGFLRDRMVFGISEDDWDSVVRVHLKGHAATTRAATAYWRDRSKRLDAPVTASIVNTASEAFLFGSVGQPNYAAAKAGIMALTLATSQGCARYGVRANAIAPRARTAMTAQAFGPPPEGPDPYAPEHVAPVVVWLASPAAQHVSGQLFVVYGGRVGLMAAPQLAGTWPVETLAQLDAHLEANPATFAVHNTLRLD